MKIEIETVTLSNYYLLRGKEIEIISFTELMVSMYIRKSWSSGQKIYEAIINQLLIPLHCTYLYESENGKFNTIL